MSQCEFNVLQRLRGALARSPAGRGHRSAASDRMRRRIEGRMESSGTTSTPVPSSSESRSSSLEISRRPVPGFTNASAEEGSTLRVPAQSSRLAHLAFQNRSNQSSLRQDLKRIGNQNTGKTGLPRVESRISAYRRVLCRNQTSTAYWKKDLSFATFLKKPSPFWRQAVQMWNTASVEGRVSKS